MFDNQTTRQLREEHRTLRTQRDRLVSQGIDPRGLDSHMSRLDNELRKRTRA